MEDTPYSPRMVTFLVSGTPISISEELILRTCPYSKLADIASYSLPGETATIGCPVDEFNALILYLQTGKLNESDDAKLEKLLGVFKLLEIPIPEHLKFKQVSTPSTSGVQPPVASSSTSYPTNMDNRPPTYDSVVPSFGFGGNTVIGKVHTEPLTIQQKITLAVEDRLTNLLMEHILPLVEGQATSGIYSGAFILVPSNSATLQKPVDSFSSYDLGPPTSHVEDKVISLSISNINLFKYVELVKLQGVGNTMQFLTQQQVIEELKKQLKARLQLPDPPPPPPPVAVPVPASSPPPKKSKWGWGRSWSQQEALPPPVAPIAPPPVPRRSPVEVRIEEVSMRRMNQMGLYETATGTVLVVEIQLA
ncbi:hypothetical protein AA313_de0202992 [Arthrobotrys entomopaga]|nr:hypothetical protein AA313_de0202992 [Arthrobotrys entomopaga]